MENAVVQEEIIEKVEEVYEPTTEDLSLRDYFAAQALSAVLDLMEEEAEDAEDFGSFALTAAARSYALADAMLIARDLEFEDWDEKDEDEDEDEDEDDEDEGAEEPAQGEDE